MGELSIQAVCGFGVGSSTLLRIKIQSVLNEMGIQADVFTGDVSSASSAKCDAIFTSSELAENLQNKTKVPVIVINNFVNQNEIREKIKEFLKTR